jgi:hypothetical protein
MKRKMRGDSLHMTTQEIWNRILFSIHITEIEFETQSRLYHTILYNFKIIISIFYFLIYLVKKICATRTKLYVMLQWGKLSDELYLLYPKGGGIPNYSI